MSIKFALRLLELGLIFVVLPLYFALGSPPRLVIFGSLWAGCFYAIYHIWRKRVKIFAPFKFSEFRYVFLRFCFFALLLTAFTLLITPKTFLYLPKKMPEIWLRVMIFYPLLSAFFQEILFRAFFKLRYRFLFRDERVFIFINALIFGCVHLLYGNLVSVLLSFCGGILFMRSYLKSSSLLLSWIEHSLYGNFIFTIGLGYFFYNGA